MDEKTDRSRMYALAASDIIDTIETETEKRIGNITFETDSNEELYPTNISFMSLEASKDKEEWQVNIGP